MISPTPEIQGRQCSTYWIHLPEHTDVVTQGYVGISVKGTQARFKSHKRSAAKGSLLHVHCAIRKHGDSLIVETLFEGTFNECMSLEKELRPAQNIGYNICAGGEITRLGMQHSATTKAKLSKAGIGRVCSDATKSKISEANSGVKKSEGTKVKLSLAAKKRVLTVADLEDRKRACSAMQEVANKLPPWMKSKSITANWLKAEGLFKYLQQESECSYSQAANFIGVTKPQVVAMFKKIKSGWNPLEDEEWLVFSSKLSPDASGDKSLQLGITPNLNN